jgi:hypothetical protein
VGLAVSDQTLSFVMVGKDVAMMAVGLLGEAVGDGVMAPTAFPSPHFTSSAKVQTSSILSNKRPSPQSYLSAAIPLSHQ